MIFSIICNLAFTNIIQLRWPWWFLYDKISKALYEGDYVPGVFLDFSEAFDAVNHEILLRKLYTYGIRVIAHDWLKSYWDCRSQYVVFNEAESKPMNITCGVSQGSILGPLLYFIVHQWHAYCNKYLISDTICWGHECIYVWEHCWWLDIVCW